MRSDSINEVSRDGKMPWSLYELTAYLARNPVCTHESVTGGPVTIDGIQARQEVTCDECGVYREERYVKAPEMGQDKWIEGDGRE
jgi:hypothetical protein